MKEMIPVKLRHSIGRTIRNFRRKAWPSFGIRFQDDIRSRLLALQVRTIFDVGANIGITALEFSDEFPEATIYAFEPNAQNLQRMQANLSGKPEVLPQMVALADKPGTGHLLINPEHPSTHRLVPTGNGSTETVAISTVDEFSFEHGISNIDIMKVDVEGHELAVLRGAKSMIASGRIKLIKMECTVDPDSSYHTQFFDICEHLHPHGYRLFSIYDQCEDLMAPIVTRSPRLTRFDCAFMSRDLQDMTGRTIDPQL